MKFNRILFKKTKKVYISPVQHSSIFWLQFCTADQNTQLTSISAVCDEGKPYKSPVYSSKLIPTWVPTTILKPLNFQFTKKK